jgi:hypothetical protein
MSMMPKIVRHLKGYGEFVRRSLISPAAHALHTRAQDAAYGTVTIVLICVLMSLLVYGYVGTLFSWLTSPFLLDTGFRMNYFQIFLRSLFLLLIAFAVLAWAMVFACRLMRSPQTIGDVVARLGASLNVPAALCLLSALLALIGSYRLSGLFLLIALLGFGTSVGFTLYSFKRDHGGGLDAFYGTILSFVVSGAVLYVISQLLI